MADLTKTGSDLRHLTPARVSLGRAGSSLDTAAILDFSLAHALARDAVHAALSIPTMLSGLNTLGLETIAVTSAAPDRATYLRRPDLGRKLSPASLKRLQVPLTQNFSHLTQDASHLTQNASHLTQDACHSERSEEPLYFARTTTSSERTSPTLTLILADGLSALAADRHVLPLLEALLPRLRPHFTLTPAIVAEQGRVALGDQIGAMLNADLTLMLLGERPGLSAPDSLGAYLTWSPRPGRTDAERNCVSNIRAGGLDYATAAARIAHLAIAAHRLQLTGTALKEASATALETGRT